MEVLSRIGSMSMRQLFPFPGDISKNTCEVLRFSTTTTYMRSKVVDILTLDAAATFVHRYQGLCDNNPKTPIPYWVACFPRARGLPLDCCFHHSSLVKYCSLQLCTYNKRIDEYPAYYHYRITSYLSKKALVHEKKG